MSTRGLIRAAASITSRFIGHSVHELSTIASSRQTTPNPYRLYQVDPQQLTKVMASRLPDSLRGTTLGGDWDRGTVVIRETSLFRGLQQRFIEGRDWIDTDLRADRYEAEYENAPRKYLAFSPEQLTTHGAKLDGLYKALERYGYQPHWRRLQSFETELAVNVSRDGELIRNSGGLHRLILSQFLELETVSLRVVVAHSAYEHPGNPRLP